MWILGTACGLYAQSPHLKTPTILILIKIHTNSRNSLENPAIEVCNPRDPIAGPFSPPPVTCLPQLRNLCDQLSRYSTLFATGLHHVRTRPRLDSYIGRSTLETPYQKTRPYTPLKASRKCRSSFCTSREGNQHLSTRRQNPCSAPRNSRKCTRFLCRCWFRRVPCLQGKQTARI